MARTSPLFQTRLGKLFCGKSEMLLQSKYFSKYRGKVDLIFTSPPFPLNKKKKYGNLQGEDYLDWLSDFGPLFNEMLSPSGSLVIEVGNAWEPDRPVQSLLPQQSLLRLLEKGNLVLCQEITYFNPARLPSPAAWVTVRRMRLKDATTKVWWMAKQDYPKADNRKVLQPYSKHMQQLLSRGKYNAGTRPSEFRIGEKSFLRDNGGSIAPNLIQVPNTSSRSEYQMYCKSRGLRGHPARMPEGVPEFFIEFLTDKGDLVLDPFAGSNTTGSVAERLGRKWLSIEADHAYAAASVSRFDAAAADSLLHSPECVR